MDPGSQKLFESGAVQLAIMIYMLIVIVMLLALSETATPTERVTLDVNWKYFLRKHDMLWNWEWDDAATYTIQPLSDSLSKCGHLNISGSCCLTSVGLEQQVFLALCENKNPEQQWILSRNSSIFNVAHEGCLINGTSDGTVIISKQCDHGWTQHEGFWMPNVIQNSVTSAAKKGSQPREFHEPPLSMCLQIDTGSAFCDFSVCPLNYTQNFTSGRGLFGRPCQPNSNPVPIPNWIGLVRRPCKNGDRSQMFGAFTLTASKQNFIPLTWATSAYIGNGVIGVRVQSEEG